VLAFWGTEIRVEAQPIQRELTGRIAEKAKFVTILLFLSHEVVR